jgi:hypothetical protein
MRPLAEACSAARSNWPIGRTATAVVHQASVVRNGLPTPLAAVARAKKHPHGSRASDTSSVDHLAVGPLGAEAASAAAAAATLGALLTLSTTLGVTAAIASAAWESAWAAAPEHSRAMFTAKRTRSSADALDAKMRSAPTRAAVSTAILRGVIMAEFKLSSMAT